MKIQVYTAITNNHDPMRDDIPVFTNYSHLCHSLAEARFYKTIPHLLFPNADWTIWVDGNVFLNVEPEELVEKCEDRDFGVFAHYHRQTVWDEASAVILGNFDGAGRVATALTLYDLAKPMNALAMTMVLVRKNTTLNRLRSAQWWESMCYSSFRDQLTFPIHFPGSGYWPTVDFTQPNKYFTRVA
jgi:hypothetical protein